MNHDELNNLADRLARYLIGVAKAGRAVPVNISRAGAKAMGVSVNDARMAQGHLTVKGRLKRSPIGQRLTVIDGVSFFSCRAISSVEEVKAILRCHYPMVIDPRTVEFPSRVASGQPIELQLGAHVLSYDLACEVAARLKNPAGSRASTGDSIHPHPARSTRKGVSMASESGQPDASAQAVPA